MKQEVPPAVIITAGVVILLIIVFIAYKKFGGDPAAKTATPEQIEAVGKMRSTIFAPGVHRDANGHFVDAQGNPVDLSAAPVKK